MSSSTIKVLTERCFDRAGSYSADGEAALYEPTEYASAEEVDVADVPVVLHFVSS